MRPFELKNRDVAFIGGGHAHALALKAWGMNPVPGARLTLIDPNPKAPYTGMLPGLVAGHYRREELEIDLVRLARHAGARLVLGKVEGIDRTNRTIKVAGRADIAYDVASINIGSSSKLRNIPGFEEHANPAKPLDRFADEWEKFASSVAEGVAPPRAAVVGGGVAGVELALAMEHRLAKTASVGPEISILEAKNDLLGELGSRARNLVKAQIGRTGIRVLTSERVAAFHPERVEIESGKSIECGFAAVAAGATAQNWLNDADIELENGFVVVDDELRSTSDPSIYAVGDCAHFGAAPLPKAGVYAVRQAPILLRNLRADLTGGSRRPYRPQRDFLRLVSVGEQRAVGQRFGLGVCGTAVWRFKDRIDRKFMRKLSELPKMDDSDPHSKANENDSVLNPHRLCGGCGSKLGQNRLQDALAELPKIGRNDVEFSGGDDAAALQIGGRTQVISTDHIRAFAEDYWLHARIASIHALGDVWAMGATPQSALAQVVLPVMADPMHEATLKEIMHGAASAFSPEGAEIIGGHTSLGTELLIGFTVTGIAEGRIIRKSGAKPGDKLILTKALGTGTILAGEMDMLADGRDVARALSEMSRPSGDASRILSKVANAMTDVSGFGLAGHLMEVLQQSGVSAVLDLDAIPFLPGAAELALRGVRSTIWPANCKVSAAMTFAPGPGADLLFDPQTAGGLLAAIPSDLAPGIMDDLGEAGVQAAQIGEISGGRPWIQVAETA